MKRFLSYSLAFLLTLAPAWGAGQIRTQDLRDGAVTTPKLADGAATNAKIGSDLDAGKIASGTLDDNRLSANVPRLSASSNLFNGTPVASASSALIQIGLAPVGANPNGNIININAPPGFSGRYLGMQSSGGSYFFTLSPSSAYYSGNVGFGGSSFTPAQRVDVRAGSALGYLPGIQIASDNGVIYGTLGIRNLSANTRAGIKINAFQSLTLAAQSFGIDFQVGSVADESVDANLAMRITSAGSVGIANPSPSEKLDVGGNIKSTGLIVGSGGIRVTKILAATAALDFPSTASGASSDLTITVTGAASGDVVSLGIPNGSMPAGAVAFTAWVSASNTVTVRFSNFSGGALDPASGTFRAQVNQF